MSRVPEVRTPPSRPLVGRDREIERIRSALRDRRGAVVAGDAGIGRTSVARAAVIRSTDLAFEPIVATGAGDAFPLAALAGLLPSPAVVDAPLAAIRAVDDALAARHGDRPVALLVDDAHRLDHASAAVVHALVARNRVRVLATVRNDAPAADDVTRLWRDAGCARIDLGPLGDDDARELIAHRLDGPIERRTLRWLLDAARGNPLHLDELLRAARDGGGIALVDGRWRRLGPVVPGPRLREIVTERIGPLDPEERRALALVALGEPLPLSALEALDALAAAGRLEARGLLVADADDPTTVRPARPLDGEVARAGLGAVEGRELRRRLAAVLPVGDPTIRRRLARWALDDGRRDDAELLTDGLADALARHDPELAVRFGRAAIEAGAGVDAVVPYSTALRATAAFADAERLMASYEDAIRDTPQMAVYLVNRAMGLQWGLRRQDDALALLQRAGGWRTDNEWRAIIRQIAATLLVTSGRLQEGIAIVEPLVELAEITDFTRLRIAITLGHSLPLVGRPHVARDAIERALAACRPGMTIEWPYETAFAAVAIATGDGWPDARRQLERVRTQAIRDDAGDRAAYVEMHLARLANLEGDGASAARLAREAFERFTLMDPREHALTSLAEQVLGEVARGDRRAARAALDRATALRANWPISLPSSHRLALAEAAVLGAEGEPVAAQRRTLRAADEAGEAVLYEAEALFEHVRLGGRPSTVLERLTRLTVAAPDTIVGRWARHVRALGNGSALEAVSVEWEAIGAPGWAAEAATAAAVAHDERGDQAAAARLRARADRLAVDRGIPADRVEAAHILARLRPREREVARLVALQLTNAEIAARLSLSVRTVESHVYRATSRLGLRSRAELAATVGDAVQ